MNRFNEINMSLKRVYALLAELEKNYQTSFKGSNYYKRKEQLEQKRDHLIKRAKMLGGGNSICIIRGKRRRPQKKNPSLSTVCAFELYLVGVSKEEVPYILELHAKNSISYSVKFIDSGKIYEI